MTTSAQNFLPDSEPELRAAEAATTDSSASADSSAPAPFQFRLRTLLGIVAAAGAVFAVLSKIGPLWSSLLVWGIVLVAAHVAGNVGGTRRTSAGPGRRLPLLPTKRALFDVRATCLRDHHGPGLTMLVGTVLGALVGGLLGTSVLWAVYGEQFGLGPVSVGGISSAGVGGFVGFLSASFVDVARRAWHEASYELRKRR